tara:strand:- start:172 stop:567 length:396 start_codon:yes stop_codon:yes gene_type:complete
MYNCFFSKKSFFSIFFALIFFNVSSQNLNKKINDNPKFLKLIELSKNANNEYFKSNYFSIQVYSGTYNKADSIMNFVKEKYINDSIYFFFETPNYKVQLGKYKSKIEAQRSLREVSKVFKSAFILKPNTKP